MASIIPPYALHKYNAQPPVTVQTWVANIAGTRYIGRVMATDCDLTTASRDELLAVIAAQQRTITTLQQRVEVLERHLGSSGGKGMPGTKPSASTRSTATGQPRKRRPHGFARRRSATPSSQVVHAADTCPHCATPLTGGWVKRRREVIELPVAPVRLVERQYVARRCLGDRHTRKWLSERGTRMGGLGRQAWTDNAAYRGQGF
jgi:hypothetical protein